MPDIIYRDTENLHKHQWAYDLEEVELRKLQMTGGASYTPFSPQRLD